jgi:hypothetical protein
MKMKLACLFVLGLLAAGCGKNKMLEAAETYEKAACACKDSACATAATTKFASDNAAAASSPLSGSDAEAYTKSTTAATGCVTKLAMAGIPAMPAMPAMPAK